MNTKNFVKSFEKREFYVLYIHIVIQARSHVKHCKELFEIRCNKPYKYINKK